MEKIVKKKEYTFLTPDGIKVTSMDFPKASRHLGIAFRGNFKVESFKFKKIKL